MNRTTMRLSLVLLASLLLPLFAAPALQAQGCRSTSISYQGTSYGLVDIGGACWFDRNLATEVYRNGETIGSAAVNADWSSAQEGRTAPVRYAESPKSGLLYNFYAVTDARGLCPAGYHVATSEDWQAVVEELGGYLVAGEALKAVPSDRAGWDGTDRVGFRALPVGIRGFSGRYFEEGVYTAWWTSTPHGADGAWFTDLVGGEGACYRHGGNVRNAGLSVRCVADR
jgi:uncharacterized protein (TIGR02145 family)